MEGSAQENVSFNSSYKYSYIILASMNSASVFVCLLAAILVFVLKLHRKVVYRLALYQVLASLALAMVGALQAIFVNYSKNPYIYDPICTVMGYLILFTEWMKLLFTMWVTFHLFCFAVLEKNLKKLEVLYIVSSILIPALIAVVPLVTKSYGPGPYGTVCYIKINSSIGRLEMFVLWDGPAIFILLGASAAMMVMVIILTRRACRRLMYEPIIEGGQYRKALQQLLPLAAFPFLFFIFELPVLAFHILTYIMHLDRSYSTTIVIIDLVFFSLWSMTSGGTLLLHISVVGYLKTRRRLHRRSLLIPPM